MTSVQSKLQKIEFALASIEELKTYHYWRFGKKQCCLSQHKVPHTAYCNQ